MLQVSPTLFSSFLAQVQSLYERLAPSPPAPTPTALVVANDVDPLRLTAGFDDPRLAHRVAEITAVETELTRNAAPGLERRRRLLNHLHRAAAAGRSFDPYLLANLLLLMDTPGSRAFLGRWNRGDFAVRIAHDAEMDQRLRGSGYTPAGQIAFYAPPGAGGTAPWIFLRDLTPLAKAAADGKTDAERRLDWVQAAVERLLAVFHEEDHFMQFSAGHGGRKNFLVNETLALLREYEVRLSLGDASIGEEAVRRRQTVAEYLAWCASQDRPEESDLKTRIFLYLKRYLGFPRA